MCSSIMIKSWCILMPFLSIYDLQCRYTSKEWILHWICIILYTFYLTFLYTYPLSFFKQILIRTWLVTERSSCTSHCSSLPCTSGQSSSTETSVSLFIGFFNPSSHHCLCRWVTFSLVWKWITTCVCFSRQTLTAGHLACWWFHKLEDSEVT